MLAGIGAALGDPMELAVRAAAGAAKRGAAVLLKHDPVEASRVVGILGLELLEGVLAHRAALPCSLGIVCPTIYLSSRDKRAQFRAFRPTVVVESATIKLP